MEIHRLSHHMEDENPPRWRCKVLRRFTSPMYRQITKCVKIRLIQQKGHLVLNKKEEYSRSILTQLEVS